MHGAALRLIPIAGVTVALLPLLPDCIMAIIIFTLPMQQDAAKVLMYMWVIIRETHRAIAPSQAPCITM